MKEPSMKFIDGEFIFQTEDIVLIINFLDEFPFWAYSSKNNSSSGELPKEVLEIYRNTNKELENISIEDVEEIEYK